jgi:hypothetical protein
MNTFVSCPLMCYGRSTWRLRHRDLTQIFAHTQRGDPTGVPFQAGGLGAPRHLPQPDRAVRRARGEAAVDDE